MCNYNISPPFIGRGLVEGWIIFYSLSPTRKRVGVRAV